MQKEIQDIINLLQQGKTIPEYYKSIIFPVENKEYELTYDGKMRKEDVLSDVDGTFAVPLQVDKTFNGNTNGWKNMIVFGDNLQFLKTCFKNQDSLIKDKVKGKVKLIYIDPPFATTDEFANKQGAKAYSDRKKGAEFIEFLRRRLIVAREILAPDGSIFIHLDSKMAHYIKIVMDEIFGKNQFRNEVVWYYKNGGGRSKSWFSQKHDTILWYSRTDNYTFNLDEIGEQRNTDVGTFGGYFKTDEDGRQYQEVRANGKIYKYYCDEIKSPDDVWEMPIIAQRDTTERTGYPTQKPETLLSRIIKAVTHEGDLVMDFFAGSGTTASVAEKLNRNWIVCDVGKLAFFTIQKRLLQIDKSKLIGDKDNYYNKKARPFISCTLGAYDLERTLNMPREDYLKFVSELFKFELKDNKVNGITFEGLLNSNPVKIFDYTNNDAIIDECYIDDLHSIIRTKNVEKIYIVAPANKVDYLSDYVEKNNTRYYFLKIPYQVIKELHSKKFVKIRQPKSIRDVNNIEESIGFHFVRTPEIESQIKVEDGKFYLVINKFKCNELEKEKKDTEKGLDNIEYLSSIYLDTNYNGKEFQLSEFHFVDEIQKDNNAVELETINKKSKQIKIIYTDIYGNDFAEIISLKE